MHKQDKNKNRSDQGFLTWLCNYTATAIVPASLNLPKSQWELQQTKYWTEASTPTSTSLN